MTLSPDAPENFWLALSLVGGLGFKTIRKLQERFGSVADVLSRPAQDLKDLGGISHELALRISQAIQAQSFRMERRLLDESPSTRLLCPESQDFPTRLAQISTPPVCCTGKATLVTWSTRALRLSDHDAAPLMDGNRPEGW